jgi:hypothetical protein
MTIKQKILAALDCDLESLTESRLLDILLDAYASKQKRIDDLERENSAERQSLRDQHELLDRVQRGIRTDPLYLSVGQYFFVLPNQQKVRVSVSGGQNIMLMVDSAGDCYLCPQITSEEYHKR